MTPDEIQQQLDELETRLDRLRALYEQYFVGIERIEPHVQKKDVERRVMLLRREQFRNTGLRFRFQMLVQRHTTYLTYWQRIVRKIEEGTFKRDLMRAQRYGRSAVARASEPPPQFELSDDDVAVTTDDDVQTTPPPASPRPTIEPRVPAAPAVPTLSARPSSPRVVEELPADMFGPESERPPAPAPAPAPAASRPAVSIPAAAPALARPAASIPARPIPAPPASTPGTAPAARRGLSPFGAAARGASGAKPGAAQVPRENAPPVAAAAVATPAAAPVSAAKPVAATPTSPRRDAMVDSVYEKYRESRRKNGEGDTNYDAVARQIEDSLPKLRQKYTQHDVSFDVTVKDGRTVLRPVVKPKK